MKSDKLFSTSTLGKIFAQNSQLSWLLFIGLIISPVFSFSQSPQIIYPKGAYMSFEEIINKTPSRQIDLQIIKRTKGDIKMNGGNDYKLDTEDESIPRKFLKKEVCAYSKGDTLYLNCLPYKVQTWYTPVISDGNFLIIRAGLSAKSKEYGQTIAAGVMFGAVGGAIAGANAAMLRKLYAIDKKDNKIIPITESSLKELLAAKPEVLQLYEAAINKKDENVQMKFLKLLNEWN